MKKIRFGLTAIKGFGEEPSQIILAEREKNGPFQNLQDFIVRLPAKLMNKKTLEALAFSGALDCFGDRGDLVASIEDIIQFAKENDAEKVSGQTDLFGGLEEEIGGDIEFKLRHKPAQKEDLLKWEKESLGLFVSDHPLKGLDAYFQKYGTPIRQLIEEHNEKIEATESNDNKENSPQITLHGIVSTIRKIITKTGKNMAIFELEDTSGKIECVLFPAMYEKNPQIIQVKEDAFLKVIGKIKEREGSLNCLVQEIAIGNLKEVQTHGRAVSLPKKSNNSATSPSAQNAGRGDTWVIAIPPQTTKTQVDQIKKVLISAQSKATEAQEVLVKIDGKEVVLPFRVIPTSEISEAITKILGEINF